MARIISSGDQSIKSAPHTPDQIVEGLKQKNTIKAFREKLQGIQFGLAVEIEVRQTDAGLFCETQKALDPSLLLLVRQRDASRPPKN